MRRECQYDSERVAKALAKLREKYLNDVEVEGMRMSALRSGHLVTSFRTARLSGALKEMLDKVFNDLDANGDGVVDKDELRAKAESEEEYTKLINSDLFKFIDEDGDQRLQRTEVDAFCTKISVRILGDMDNAMTRAQARRA